MVTLPSATPAVRLTMVTTVSRRKSRGDRHDRRSTGVATCEPLGPLLPAPGTLLERFGCGHLAAVLEGILPALASAHATTNTGQLAAKPGDTAARRRALERA